MYGDRCKFAHGEHELRPPYPGQTDKFDVPSNGYTDQTRYRDSDIFAAFAAASSANEMHSAGPPPPYYGGPAAFSGGARGGGGEWNSAFAEPAYDATGGAYGDGYDGYDKLGGGGGGGGFGPPHPSGAPQLGPALKAFHERHERKFKEPFNGGGGAGALGGGGRDGGGFGGAISSKEQSFFKTQLCRNWEMGDCHYSDRCRFAHGLDELRVRADGRGVLAAAPPPPLTDEELAELEAVRAARASERGSQAPAWDADAEAELRAYNHTIALRADGVIATCTPAPDKAAPDKAAPNDAAAATPAPAPPASAAAPAAAVVFLSLIHI